MTTLLVTHDQEEAMSIADRIAVMDHARIEQVGGPRELYDRPATRFVACFLGRSASSATGSCARTTSRSASTARRRRLRGDGLAASSISASRCAWSSSWPAAAVSAQLTRHAIDELDIADGDIVWLRALTTTGLGAQPSESSQPSQPAASTISASAE